MTSLHLNCTDDYNLKAGLKSRKYNTIPRHNSQNDRITVRLPPENIVQLCDVSSISQIDLDELINRIIKEHLDWHSNAAESRMLYMPEPIITKTISLLTEQQLSDIAEYVADTFVNLSLLLRGEFTYSTFMDIIDNWFRMTSTTIRYQQNDSESRIIIRHGMGYNYGYILRKIFQSIMGKRFHIEIDYRYHTDNTLVLEFIE